VVDDAIYDEVVAELTRLGARVLEPAEVERLADPGCAAVELAARRHLAQVVVVQEGCHRGAVDALEPAVGLDRGVGRAVASPVCGARCAIAASRSRTAWASRRAVRPAAWP